jgi:hypothetical protein
LPGMGVTMRGLAARHSPCHDHPVILQSRMVAEASIVAVEVRCSMCRSGGCVKRSILTSPTGGSVGLGSMARCPTIRP